MRAAHARVRMHACMRARVCVLSPVNLTQRLRLQRRYGDFYVDQPVTGF